MAQDLPTPGDTQDPGNTAPATPGGAPSLHQHALDAERSLEQLATGLAQSGVSDGVVSSVTKMAEMMRQLVGALGAGQEVTGDAQPPADQALAPTPPTQPRTVAGAAHGLMADMQAANSPHA